MYTRKVTEESASGNTVTCGMRIQLWRGWSSLEAIAESRVGGTLDFCHSPERRAVTCLWMVLLLRVSHSALVPVQIDGIIGFKLSSTYYFRELRCCPFHAQRSSALGLRGSQNFEGGKFSGKCQDAGELHTV